MSDLERVGVKDMENVAKAYNGFTEYRSKKDLKYDPIACSRVMSVSCAP